MKAVSSTEHKESNLTHLDDDYFANLPKTWVR